MRQKSQNSTSTGWPTCWSIRSIATFTHSRAGSGGAAMESDGARIGAAKLAPGSVTPAGAEAARRPRGRRPTALRPMRADLAARRLLGGLPRRATGRLDRR